jgi:hypothetical protein
MKKWPEQWEQRGIQKGRMEAMRDTARNLIAMNVLTDVQIAQASGLTEAEVETLRAEIKH